MRRRLLALVIPALAIAAVCSASTIQFDDLTDNLVVTIDGQVITGNGGRITNYTTGTESVSFDITTGGSNFISTSGYTQLLDPINSDDPVGTISDVFLYTTTLGATTYHVAFGSDTGTFPMIPSGAVDLTTVPEQGLPPNPYYENSTFQKVGTVFSSPNVALDTYFVRSAVSDVPEPGTVTLLGAGLLLAIVGHRKRKTRV